MRSPNGTYPRPMTSSAGRVAKHRRLQAWYREHQLEIAEAGIGVNGKPVESMLPTGAVAQRPELNFLTSTAFRHAERRIVEVREEGRTLDEDRRRRNLLSSMPLCFNIFGALGTHPAFASLIRSSGLDHSAATVDDVVCEWAPRPTCAHLGDRSAFDALVRYTTDGGRPRFIGVETRYTDTFSPKEYERDEYVRVTRESGWFKPGAETVLQKSATNQLWRTMMLAASVEVTGELGHGTVLVLTLADDDGAAACVAALRSQLNDDSRLHHVTYEALMEACDWTNDPDLVAWAGRFRSRYLDADQLMDRVVDPAGPRFERQLDWPKREFTAGGDLYGSALAEALSWGLAARLARRHPELRITEEHPGGGQYDCLTIVGLGDGAFDHIHLNRVGSGFVWTGGGWTWTWRGIWDELAAKGDFRFGVQLLEFHAGLPSVDATPPAQSHTVGYRLIALILMSGIGSRTWRASYDFGGETWTGLSVPSWVPRIDGSWLLHRDGEPVLAIDCDSGVAVRVDGTRFELLPTYVKDRRISALLPTVLGKFAS